MSDDFPGLESYLEDMKGRAEQVRTRVMELRPEARQLAINWMAVDPDGVVLRAKVRLDGGPWEEFDLRHDASL